MMKHKKLVVFFGLLVILIVGSGGVLAALLLNRPFRISEPTFVYVDSDDTEDSVYVKLETKLHASSLAGFRLLASVYGYGDHIRTGAYRVTPGENTYTVFFHLERGHQTPVRLIISSVRTLDRLARNVSRQIMADSSQIAGLLADSVYLKGLGFTRETVPAFFIPDTYEVYWNMTASDFMKRMQKEYKRFWNTERLSKAQELGLTPVEVATLASIVEEETANNAEKPVIAGLYLNRLRIGMPLQADPTVKFGLQDFSLRRILHKHLETDSPYNTYKNTGLPPGPIRIPSVVGLESVLNYQKHDYLYMCAKEDFSGTHNFASTLSEHQANARRYQKALNRAGIMH